MHQRRLGRRRPEPVARPFAETKSGSIERNHAMTLGKAVNQPAREEVLQPYGIAVQKHDRCPLAPLNVMEAHAVDLHESALRWLIPLDAARLLRYYCRSCRERPQT